MKKFFAVMVIVLGTGMLADAQTVIGNEKMFHDTDSVTVTFDLDTDNTDLPVRRKEVILPYIYNEKDTLYLDVVEVYGRGRYKRERQVNAVNGDRDWELGENQVMKKEGIYCYESKVPLKRWMKVANLGIRRQIVGCACESDVTDENIAQDSLFKDPQVQRRIPEYVLADVDRMWDFGRDELEIVFKVSKTEIDSSVFDNEITFGKILKAVDNIFRNPKYRFDKIQVAGYASPEGPPAFNNWLGENRAKALIDYIIKHRPQYNLTMDNFEIVNGEENWAGLRRVLVGSYMKGKDQVIAIIDDEKLNGEQKKLKIWAMEQGRVWRRMLKNIYPYLRCARYLAVYYDSTDDEAADLINQANSLIREGKYTEAIGHMDTVKEDVRSYNTMGVALMMQGKFEEAMPWFEKALENNCLSAQSNIDAINVEYAHEEQQRRDIAEYLKKYE